MEKAASSFRHEIIFQIFSWLPAKSLISLKCVYKFCNSLVSESDFVYIHRCHSVTRPGGTKFLMQGVGVYYTAELKKVYYTAEQKKYEKGSDSFVQIERFYKMLDHAPAYSSSMNCVNDLFCVWEPFSVQPAAIFNPSTREVRFLPLLNDFFLHNYSFGFEPEEKKFKVLLSAKHVKEGYIKYWVLTLGVDKLWREIQSIFPFTPYYIKPRICINGVIYQFVTTDNDYAIAAFDVKSEKFEISAFWNAIESVYHSELIEVKGELAVVDYERWLSGYIFLWISRKEWEKHIIFFPSIWKDGILPTSISSSMSAEGKIVFVLYLKSGTLCLCYDVITKIWKKIKGFPKKTYIKGIYSYVERLVM